jgi:hypothetical protein
MAEDYKMGNAGRRERRRLVNLELRNSGTEMGFGKDRGKLSA